MTSETLEKFEIFFGDLYLDIDVAYIELTVKYPEGNLTHFQRAIVNKALNEVEKVDWIKNGF